MRPRRFPPPRSCSCPRRRRHPLFLLVEFSLLLGCFCPCLSCRHQSLSAAFVNPGAIAAVVSPRLLQQECCWLDPSSSTANAATCLSSRRPSVRTTSTPHRHGRIGQRHPLPHTPTPTPPSTKTSIERTFTRLFLLHSNNIDNGAPSGPSSDGTPQRNGDDGDGGGGDREGSCDLFTPLSI
jgi:hypothetical protein